MRIVEYRSNNMYTNINLHIFNTCAKYTQWGDMSKIKNNDNFFV